MQDQTAGTTPISFIHQTKDGLVHLLVRAVKKRWVAMYWDSEVAGISPCATLAEANETVLRCFRNICLGHQCSTACGPVDDIGVHKSDDLWGMIRDI
ncbi:MAG: hypothetical protein LAP39_29690 [Acidobacteriia bacterium]|nr:hypothetical protein [Terriglobia bacterium]